MTSLTKCLCKRLTSRIAGVILLIPALPLIALEAQGSELLSQAQLAQWLADDPQWQLALAQKQALEAQAVQTAGSGYEWTASYSRQERSYDQPELAGLDKSREWNLELERSLRLPGKGAASKRQAEALRNLASASEQADMRNLVDGLLQAYLDALQASASLGLLAQELTFARANLHAVEHRVKAGDAPALDARLAAAETQALEREVKATGQLASSLWTNFQHRYPKAQLPAFAFAAEATSMNDGPREDYQAGTTHISEPAPLAAQALQSIPMPSPIEGTLAEWKMRIFAQQPALQQADARLAAASAATDRARRDRIPDPSLAIYSGRESFGNEQVMGIRLSMPIPGSHRGQALRQSYAEESAARAERELLQRALIADTENRYQRARSDYQRWELARQMAANFRENARLLHNAYRLGEQDLQGLLLGQQQHTRAALAEVESRVQALRSAHQLRLAAGELNPFASDTPFNSPKP